MKSPLGYLYRVELGVGDMTDQNYQRGLLGMSAGEGGSTTTYLQGLHEREMQAVAARQNLEEWEESWKKQRELESASRPVTWEYTPPPFTPSRQSGAPTESTPPTPMSPMAKVVTLGSCAAVAASLFAGYHFRWSEKAVAIREITLGNLSSLDKISGQEWGVKEAVPQLTKMALAQDFDLFHEGANPGSSREERLRIYTALSKITGDSRYLTCFDTPSYETPNSEYYQERDESARGRQLVLRGILDSRDGKTLSNYRDTIHRIGTSDSSRDVRRAAWAVLFTLYAEQANSPIPDATRTPSDELIIKALEAIGKSGTAAFPTSPYIRSFIDDFANNQIGYGSQQDNQSLRYAPVAIDTLMRISTTRIAEYTNLISKPSGIVPVLTQLAAEQSGFLEAHRSELLPLLGSIIMKSDEWSMDRADLAAQIYERIDPGAIAATIPLSIEKKQIEVATKLIQTWHRLPNRRDYFPQLEPLLRSALRRPTPEPLREAARQALGEPPQKQSRE